MRQLSVILSLTILVFATMYCQERKDKTVERNLLTFLLTCEGGSLQACQSACAARYPDVTGENFPAISTCNSSCTSNCNLSNLYLLISNQ